MTLDLSLLSTQNYWSELEKFLKNTDYDIDLIKKCYDFSYNAHKNQFRESGENYITHPVWIAKVAAQLNIGQEAVLTALLHDCVEDTSVTLEEISEKFGDEVGLLVSGLTEVAKKTEGIQINETSIEVFRRFLFSSIDDVRVLILRLTDKLHNGFTIKYLPKERQIKYAKNILGIYGPVAEYVGLHYFKKILDDIAFEILYPDEAAETKKLFENNKKNEIQALTMVNEDLDKMLKINNINNFNVEGRIKSLYSTYKKILKKGRDRIKDRVAIRIFVDNIADCYTVLGLLHAKFKYLPDEFVDYISSPKPNGYQTIQTAVIWKNGLIVEIQIKTYQMHEFNEFGPASHIAYKLGKTKDQGSGYEWVKELVKWQSSENSIYQLKILTKYIYVFTPKGDTIQMPQGSTALDFAYRIHSDIGDHCFGVKINNKIAKINEPLKTGDLVEILINKKMNVNKNWLSIVKTSWAKDHIRKIINN